LTPADHEPEAKAEAEANPASDGDPQVPTEPE